MQTAMERRSLTAVDAAFHEIGGEPGLMIWRVENFELKEWPLEHLGTFFTGDCYMLLLTTCDEVGHLSWDIIYWQGAKSHCAERAIAAFKCTELHQSLECKPTQHREEEGSESAMFHEMFPQVVYMAGGFPSSLKPVVLKHPYPRLIHLKGNKNAVRVNLVPLSSTSLNSDDVFILDTESIVYQWNGSKCNIYERATAMQLTIKIKNFEKRPTNSTIISMLEEGREDASFWAHLGGRPRRVAPAAVVSDDEYQRTAILDMYEIRDTTVDGEADIEIRLVDKNARGNVEYRSLKSTSVYLLDCETSLLVWMGLSSSRTCKQTALTMARDSIKQFKRPAATPIEHMLQGAESPLFQARMQDWHRFCLTFRQEEDPLQWLRPTIRAPSMSKALKVMEATPAHIVCPAPILEDQPSSGDINIYRVELQDLAPVDSSEIGLFNTCFSYICLYSYISKGSLRHMVYYWEGKHAPRCLFWAWKFETSQDLVKGLQESTGVPPVYQRVFEMCETDHFLSLFADHPIIISCNVDEKKPCRLFVVRGHEPLHTRVLEVECTSGVLCSTSVFLLKLAKQVLMWRGNYMTKAEYEVGKRAAARLAGEEGVVVEIKEGQEPEDFWNALGGRTESPSMSERELMFLRQTSKNSVYGRVKPRMFVCNFGADFFSFSIEEVHNYNQKHLNSLDVLLLDAYGTVYVWTGRSVGKFKSKIGLMLAERYARGRDAGLARKVVRIAEGQETRAFKSHFIKWEEATVFIDPYDKTIDWLRSIGVVGREVPRKIPVVQPKPQKREESKMKATKSISGKLPDFGHFETLKLNDENVVVQQIKSFAVGKVEKDNRRRRLPVVSIQL